MEKAISIEPGERDAHGKLAWASAAICDWDRLNAIAASLRARIKDGRSICEPFALLGLCDDAELHLICVKAVLGKGISAPSQVGTLASRPRDSASDRLRIAYLSSDFRRHPTANLITGLLEHHDRSRFLVEAVSIGQDDGSGERKRIISAVDTFIDAADKSDNEIAGLIRKHRIDILVDLNGLARGGRLGLLAQRPASVQVNYLGYPGSVGANLADYVIADKIILPADRQQFYSEQIIRLPDYYVAYDPLVADIPPAPPRHEAGLPESGIVFCCFNNSFKICETVFSIWMRLLRSVPDSVLWLFQDTPAVMVNLRKHASARGVDPSRLVFAERVSLGEHLARHRLADLFLDTLPYNAHTTACDALWMGLPLVTCAGQAFAGRVGASLLAGVRLPELVTVSHDDYEALALKLATNPLLLHSYRERLTENRASAPPFDAGRLSRQIEAAYSRISEIFQSGEKPRGFTVEQT